MTGCLSSSEKAQLIIEYFAHNDVDPEIPIYCMISPRQATQLFGQEQYVAVEGYKLAKR